jgi:hypothetical protein
MAAECNTELQDFNREATEGDDDGEKRNVVAGID